MSIDKNTALREFANMIRSQRDKLRLKRITLAKKVGVEIDVLNWVEHHQADKVEPSILVRTIENLRFPEDQRNKIYTLIPVFLFFPVSPPPRNSTGRYLKRC